MDKFLFQKLKSNQKKPQILENGCQLVAICHLTLVSGKLNMNLNVLFYNDFIYHFGKKEVGCIIICNVSVVSVLDIAVLQPF